MAATEGVRVEAGYIPAIEGLRGLAVLWVMLFHYVVMREGRFGDPFVEAIAAAYPLDVIAHQGYLGVDLFFVITGFLLTLPWFLRQREGLPPPSLRDFYARRFWRIVPAYYVQLMVLFLVVAPLLRGAGWWKRDLYVIAYNAVAHGLFLQNTTPLSSSSLAINGALWTLSLEAQYYVLLPLLAPIFIRAPLRMLAAAIAIALAWQWGARAGFEGFVAMTVQFGERWHWTEETARHLLLTQLPSYTAHFAIGILAGRAWVEWRHRAPSAALRRALHVATGLALLGVYVVFAHAGGILGYASWIVTPLALGVAFLAIAAGDGGHGNALLGRGPLPWLGRISYSAYLYHLLVLELWNRFAPPLGWTSFPLFLATVVVVAWLSWRYVEAPFTRAARQPTASAMTMAKTWRSATAQRTLE